MSTYPKRTGLDAGINTYWRKKLFDYDINDNMIYYGKHVEHDALDSDTSHMIYKLTYDINNNLIKLQILSGAWDNRTTLSW